MNATLARSTRRRYFTNDGGARYYLSAAGGKISAYYAYIEAFWASLPICPDCGWHMGADIIERHAEDPVREGCR